MSVLLSLITWARVKLVVVGYLGVHQSQGIPCKCTKMSCWAVTCTSSNIFTQDEEEETEQGNWQLKRIEIEK